MDEDSSDTSPKKDGLDDSDNETEKKMKASSGDEVKLNGDTHSKEDSDGVKEITGDTAMDVEDAKVN